MPHSVQHPLAKAPPARSGIVARGTPSERRLPFGRHGGGLRPEPAG